MEVVNGLESTFFTKSSITDIGQDPVCHSASTPSLIHFGMHGNFMKKFGLYTS